MVSGSNSVSCFSLGLELIFPTYADTDSSLCPILKLSLFLIALMHITTYDGQGKTCKAICCNFLRAKLCSAPVLTLSKLKTHSIYIDDHMVA